ncbi:MAG: hypothetical protein R3B74_16500, partial [Nitrospirales bacterium]|nr:hypothetical protein [Nitrospirales bacterium]
LHRSHLRQDWTVKPDAFIPHPWPDLSVTRHLQLSEPELWNIAKIVAKQTEKTLYGRVDVRALDFERQTLRVVSTPVLENPNHASVSGWPVEKSAQKAIAQEITQAAGQARKAPPTSD